MPSRKPSEPAEAVQATRQICLYSGCRQPALEGQRWCATHTDPKYHQRRPSRCPKRPCARPGCHNYAMRGSDRCRVHHPQLGTPFPPSLESDGCAYAGCRNRVAPGQLWCAQHADPKYHQRRLSRYPKRFCAHPGCRKYARHDMEYCSSHDTPAKREGGLRRAPCPRCAHPGCRKYALRGERYCMHHHPDRPRPPRAPRKSSSPKIPCAQPGCQSWAMHGQKYCYVHRTPQGRAYASRPHAVHCAFPDCKKWALIGQEYCYAHSTEERRQNALLRRQGHRSLPCSYPGCRKRAMIGQNWCRQHHPMGNADAAALMRQHGFYSKYYSQKEFRFALEAAGVEDIKQELVLARLTLRRVIDKYEQSPQELEDVLAFSEILFRGAGLISRLLKLDRQLDPNYYRQKAEERLLMKLFGVNSMEEVEAILEEIDRMEKEEGK